MPLLTVRYGLPLVLFVLGVVFLVVEPNATGLEGFCGATGAGLALLALNLIFRVGVAGDRDREREEAAREYFDLHGRWPDEDAEAARRPAADRGDAAGSPAATAEPVTDGDAPGEHAPGAPRPLRDAVRPSAGASSPNRGPRREGARITRPRPSRRP